MSDYKIILENIIKKKNFFSILKKIIRKFEKNTSNEALKWAKANTRCTTAEFCRSIDHSLYNQICPEIEILQNEAKFKLSKLNVKLGGGGNYFLLYFLVRKFKPITIIETGVAAGWSSLAILKALQKNGKGRLYSSDLPYLRIENPEKYIGYLAKNEINVKDWFLDIRGDEVALPAILRQIDTRNINLIHYDSDKSYSAREKAFKILSYKLSSDTIIIFDDIQDNLHFKNLINKLKYKFYVLEFEGKYIGIIGDILFKK